MEGESKRSDERSRCSIKREEVEPKASRRSRTASDKTGQGGRRVKQAHKRVQRRGRELERVSKPQRTTQAKKILIAEVEQGRATRPGCPCSR